MDMEQQERLCLAFVKACRNEFPRLDKDREGQAAVIAALVLLVGQTIQQFLPDASLRERKACLDEFIKCIRCETLCGDGYCIESDGEIPDDLN